jgi:UDPglucose 6-dehydrogenase
MKITIVGTGYVGLVTGACLANEGNDVLCVDLDTRMVAQLSDGLVPIYEPGLQDIVRRNLAAGRLRFTADVAEGARFGRLQFIAVGTPPDNDGSADLSHVRAAARTIGEHMDGDRVVINKSTVPVGTACRGHEAISTALAARGATHSFSVVSNPEFLKEGAAVADFTRPDRIVIGSDDDTATALLRELYAPFGRNHERLMVMSVRSAEMTKYVANAKLATRISFMNEMALLAEDLGADIDAVRRGIGSDEPIGHHFLYVSRSCSMGATSTSVR